jgi:hypothetical protein
MLTRRDFYGESHYIWILKQYETARTFLKSCGRPDTEYDKYLISEAKWTSAFYKKMLD